MKTKLHLLIPTTPERPVAPARRFPLAPLVLNALLLCAPPGVTGQTNSAEEYTFFTLAGPADLAAGPIDGQGSAARFKRPGGVAVDAAGNVYVADALNCTIRKMSPAGMVATLAGNSSYQSWGAVEGGYADGRGSAARFNSLGGVAVDSVGNVYVADTGNATIRMISPVGEVTTLAGQAGQSGSADGTCGAARFSSPEGLAVDSGGNVYVADTWNHTIRKLTPEGVVSTVAGQAGERASVDGNGSAARFNAPAGVAVDGSGNLYVAEIYNSAIRKISPAGDVTTIASLAPGVDVYPHDVAVDSAGNVYVAESGTATIRKISPTGLVTTLAGQAGQVGSADGTCGAARFSSPEGLAVDSGGNVYVADTVNSTIRKITPGGEVTTLAGQPGSVDGTGSTAGFGLASGVAAGGDGNIYVADLESHTIRKIGPGGVVTTIAGRSGDYGSSDGAGAAARFNGPAGVAADVAGNVYVADSGNSTIRKISPAGQVTTLAGTAGEFGSADGAGSAARFSGPEGVAVDDSGNVYVADTGNSTIRKIGPAGEVTTLAGTAGHWGSADGTGSAARFRAPGGVAVDGAGCVYVADIENNTIRKISSAGVVTTLAGNASATNQWGGVDGGFADGTGAAARFNWPYGVAVDKAGNVYVTDGRNSCIRKVTPAGVVTTLAGQPGSEGNANGTGSAARFTLLVHGLFYDCVWAGIAVDESGAVYVADSGSWWLSTPSTIRIGFRACADRPMVDLPLAPVDVTRQLDTAPQTATVWQWSWLRRPAGSQSELSSTTVRNPTFTPDVPDLYVFRLLATNQVTGTVSLRTLALSAVPANVAVLSSPQRLPDGAFQLTLIGQTNQAYALQVSTNLSTWTDWTNVTPTSFSTLLTDPEAARHPQCFYRVRKR